MADTVCSGGRIAWPRNERGHQVNAYYVESRTVYGRTTYCVLSGGSAATVIARCDDRQAAHLVCSLLNAHTESALAAVKGGAL